MNGNKSKHNRNNLYQQNLSTNDNCKENNIQKSNLWKDPKHFFTIECTQINNFGEHDASVQRKWKQNFLKFMQYEKLKLIVSFSNKNMYVCNNGDSKFLCSILFSIHFSKFALRFYIKYLKNDFFLHFLAICFPWAVSKLSHDNMQSVHTIF